MSAEAAMDNAEEGRSLAGTILRWMGLGAFFILALIFFTALKVPQTKVHGWILGTVNQQISPMGFQISADEGRLALGLSGLRYEMNGVRVNQMMNQKTLRFSRFEVSPSFLPLLQGKLGGDFSLREGNGAIEGTFLRRGENFETRIDLKDLNLGRMGALPVLAKVDGTAEIKGSIEILGAINQPSSFSGKIDLNLARIVIDEQKISGFQIPRTSISDGAINIGIGAGKATFNSFRIGKAGSNDDMHGAITGDIKLARTLDSSDANLKLKFGFSERYRQEKTISILDSLLGMFKLPDSSFALRLSGPIYAIQPMPDQ
jgi:type II secretion system protein N